MPCPFFEPTREVNQPAHANGRLPLIDEYEGLCHASGSPAAAPSSLQFQCCNHGYSKEGCPCFPPEETRSSIRYSVVKRTDTALELICVEETAHTPSKWYRLDYFLETATVSPGTEAVCVLAQAAAFCRAYLRHFSA